MRNKYIESFEEAQLAKKEIPQFRAGDTLRVAVRIKEGSKERVQNYEGVCIAIRGEGTGRTFMVRKMGANNVVLREFSHYTLIALRALQFLEEDELEELNYSILES